MYGRSRLGNKSNLCTCVCMKMNLHSETYIACTCMYELYELAGNICELFGMSFNPKEPQGTPGNPKDT